MNYKDLYTDDDPETLILSKLIRYADHHRSFDRDYVDEIYDFFYEYNYITVNQLRVLEQIYSVNGCDKFFVEEEDE